MIIHRQLSSTKSPISKFSFIHGTPLKTIVPNKLTEASKPILQSIEPKTIPSPTANFQPHASRQRSIARQIPLSSLINTFSSAKEVPPKDTSSQLPIVLKTSSTSVAIKLAASPKFPVTIQPTLNPNSLVHILRIPNDRALRIFLCESAITTDLNRKHILILLKSLLDHASKTNPIDANVDLLEKLDRVMNINNIEETRDIATAFCRVFSRIGDVEKIMGLEGKIAADDLNVLELEAYVLTGQHDKVIENVKGLKNVETIDRIVSISCANPTRDLNRFFTELYETLATEPSTAAYQSMILLSYSTLDFTTSERLIQNMKEGGLRPTLAIYNSRMKAILARRDSLKDVYDTFEEMVGSGITPNEAAFTYLLDSLCRAEADPELIMSTYMTAKIDLGLQGDGDISRMFGRFLAMRTTAKKKPDILALVTEAGYFYSERLIVHFVRCIAGASIRDSEFEEASGGERGVFGKEDLFRVMRKDENNYGIVARVLKKHLKRHFGEKRNPMLDCYYFKIWIRRDPVKAARRYFGLITEYPEALKWVTPPILIMRVLVYSKYHDEAIAFWWECRRVGIGGIDEFDMVLTALLRREFWKYSSADVEGMEIVMGREIWSVLGEGTDMFGSVEDRHRALGWVFWHLFGDGEKLDDAFLYYGAGGFRGRFMGIKSLPYVLLKLAE